MIISNQGKTLRLRQSTEDDVSILLDAYQDESFIRLYRSNNPKQTEKQLREDLAKRAKRSPTKIGYLELMIEHKQYGPIGVAALGDYSPLHKRAEYMIGLFDEKHRHAGYGVEAALLVIDLAFNKYHLNKVYCYVYDYNEYTNQGVIRFGFKNEGILEQHHFSLRENRFVDLYINGMTAKHFRENKKLRRMSIRLLGRDITQEPQVMKVSSDNELPVDAGKRFLDGLRAMANNDATGT